MAAGSSGVLEIDLMLSARALTLKMLFLGVRGKLFG
jgi:hypothetical protein